MGNRNTPAPEPEPEPVPEPPVVAVEVEKPKEKAKCEVSVEEKTFRWEIKIGSQEELESAKHQQFECTMEDSKKGSKSSWMFWIPQKDMKDPETNKEAMLFYMLKKDRRCRSEVDARVSVKMQLSYGVEIAEGQSDTGRWKHRAGETRICYVENDKSHLMNPSLAKNMKPPTDTPLTFVFIISMVVVTKVEPEDHEELEETANDTVEKIQWKRTDFLCQMIQKLENDPKYSDMKIVSSDGKEFYAYSWMLDGMSDVFKAVFQSDLEMKKENDKEDSRAVIKLDDVSGTTVKLILHFSYTGEVADEWSAPETLEEFISVVDKYQIEDLKMFLDASLGKICTVENAGSLLTLATKASLSKAQADIGAFVAENCGPDAKKPKLN